MVFRLAFSAKLLFFDNYKILNIQILSSEFEIFIILFLSLFIVHSHLFFPRLLDICHGRNYPSERQFTLYLVFEHVDQDLSSFMQRYPSPGLSPEMIKDIMFQILTGVDFLHSNRIVHRDIKPANILISNNGKIKLADFGLARIYEHAQLLTALVVTLWYRAPEVLLQANYASPIDIWSCGCIFAELYNRRPLFSGQSENEQLCRIFDMIGAPKQDEWPKEISIPCSNFAAFRKQNLSEIIQDVCPAGKELFEVRTC